jgi:glucose/arabinose dehydrogenase
LPRNLGQWDEIGHRGTLFVGSTAAGNALSYKRFAEGWLDSRSQGAWGRPVDVPAASDGTMPVSDDYAGAIYRIR